MKISVWFLSLLILWGCSSEPEADVAWVDAQLQYCAVQAEKTLKLVPDSVPDIPRNVNAGSVQWRFVDYKDWTSGFWPGVLWYLYEGTSKEAFKQQADRFSRELTPLSEQPAYDHDLGFQIFNSFGNGYRLTGNPEYKSVVLKSSEVLATLFNPKAGTILSWPREVQKFGGHNTIIDNMINLEMLMWASKNGGDKKLADIALSHAETTMKNQFNEAFITGHVVVYDTLTGKKIRRITHQGLHDNSMWARGQSWAIYGYTMMYRETQKPEFLDFAQKVTDVYLKRLPEDLVPYWDFDDTRIPDAPRDASAAAVTASALLELSGYIQDKNKAEEYKTKAIGMLKELSSERYQSRDKNTAFLLHSTGHHPNGTEIDASIIYADYYYIEALLRLKKLLVKKVNEH